MLTPPPAPAPCQIPSVSRGRLQDRQAYTVPRLAPPPAAPSPAVPPPAEPVPSDDDARVPRCLIQSPSGEMPPRPSLLVPANAPDAIRRPFYGRDGAFPGCILSQVRKESPRKSWDSVPLGKKEVERCQRTFFARF